MLFGLDDSWVIYVLIGISAALLAETVYLVGFSTRSYRKHVNRRLRLNRDSPDRSTTLVALRKERGLTESGLYSLPLMRFNRLILQSGIRLQVHRLVLVCVVLAAVTVLGAMHFGFGLIEALLISVVVDLGFLYALANLLRRRRQAKFAAQLPDALDLIVRSLRAGHPIGTAISLVGRELADPAGTEFGMMSDEIAYGVDLDTALRNLYYRVGQQDLPLFVTAVSIQTSTGGNLSEILQELAGVIRLRFKLRRKVKALAAEGRFSAILLSGVPIVLFLILNSVAPSFYGSVLHHEATFKGLAIAGIWMAIGNYVMYRLVSFKF
jgi:tight adherence protein B